MSDTSFDVGTTTSRLGLTRYGPVAPVAFQRGKYEIFTNTGSPTRLTWKESVCVPTLTALTFVTPAMLWTCIRWIDAARGHDAGPDSAPSTFQSDGCSHHVWLAVNQPTRLEIADTTLGTVESGTTSGLFLMR